MTIRSKILAAAAGIAAVFAAVVATPGQGNQAHAGSAISSRAVASIVHGGGP